MLIITLVAAMVGGQQLNRIEYTIRGTLSTDILDIMLDIIIQQVFQRESVPWSKTKLFS